MSAITHSQSHEPNSPFLAAALLEEISHPAVLVDASGLVQAVNGAALVLLKAGGSEIVGCHISRFISQVTNPELPNGLGDLRGRRDVHVDMEARDINGRGHLIHARVSDLSTVEGGSPHFLITVTNDSSSARWVQPNANLSSPLKSGPGAGESSSLSQESSLQDPFALLRANPKMEQVGAWALHQIQARFPQSRSAIFFLDPTTGRPLLLSTSGYPNRQISRLSELARSREGLALIANSAALSQICIESGPDSSLRRFDPQAGALAVLPLVAAGGSVGLISLAEPNSETALNAENPDLVSLTQFTGVLLQNAWLRNAEESHSLEKRILQEATATLTLDLPLQEVLRGLLERLRRIVPYDSSAVLLRRGDFLHVVAANGFPDPSEVLTWRFPADNPLIRRLQKERAPIVLADAKYHPDFLNWGATSHVRGWLGVPLFHHDNLLGYITLDSRLPNAYSATEAAMAAAFAHQATVTIINAELLQNSQKTSRERHEVSQILRNLSSTTSDTALLPAMAGGLRIMTGCDAIELTLYLKDSRLGTTSYAYWDESGETCFEVERALSDERLEVELEHKDLASDTEGYGSSLSFPLHVGERSTGLLRLFWHDESDSHDANWEALQQVADAAAVVIEKNRLLMATQQRAEELATLTRFSTEMRSLEDRDEIIKRALQISMETFGASRGRASIPAPDDEKALDVVVQIGDYTGTSDMRYRHDDSLVGHVFLSEQPLLSRNIFSEKQAHSGALRSWQKEGYESAQALFAPLRADESVIGVLSIVVVNPAIELQQHDLQLFSAMAEIAGGALQRANLLATLEQRVESRTHELAEANLRLRELDQLKSNFVANVSHELRTPLTNLKLYLDLLARGRSEKRENYMQVLNAEVDRLYTLIEAVLELSRLDSQTSFHLEREWVDLHSVIEQVVERHMLRAKEAGVEIGATKSEKPLYLLSRRIELVQVLTNLIGNGINYSPEGGVVQVDCDFDGDEALIRVRDSGIGIAEEDYEAIFERFYRGERVSQSTIPGTGLGLSIVKEIVTAYGGEIEVESRLGEGTSFTVRLPGAKSA